MNLTKNERNIVQSTLRKWHQMAMGMQIAAHRVSADGMVTDKEGKHIGQVKSVIWTKMHGPAKDRKCKVQYLHFRVGGDYKAPPIANRMGAGW